MSEIPGYSPEAADQGKERDNTELDRLLAEDAIGQKLGKLSKINSDLHEFDHITRAYNGLSPEQFSELEKVDWDSPEDQASAATVLGVESGEIARWIAATKPLSELTEQAEREWEAELPSSNIKEINADSFPQQFERPSIIYFGSDWCTDCKLIRPELAKLSRHFEKADLYFTEDEDLSDSQGVEEIPALVAYSPDGKKTVSECGNHTRELWEQLNKLGE